MTDQNSTETAEKSTSERLALLWRQLSHNQRRFVIASQEYANKKDAAAAIGVEPNTVYRWPKIVDDAIEAFSDSIVDSAAAMLSEAAAKAAAVKVAGLDSDNEKIRQDVATEIIDRVMGKATQRQEVEHSGGIEIEYVNDWRNA